MLLIFQWSRSQTATLKQNLTLDLRCMDTQNLVFLSQIIKEKCSGRDYSRTETRGQGQRQ